MFRRYARFYLVGGILAALLVVVGTANALTGPYHTTVVDRGETLSGIAKQFHVKQGYWGIFYKNKFIKDPDLILEGWKLQVPINGTVVPRRSLAQGRFVSQTHRHAPRSSAPRFSGGLTSAERWIIMRESGNRTTAKNPNSTAFGLGQLLDYNRATYAARIGVSPSTIDYGAQLKMFRMYVADRYGNAERAKAFWITHGWY